MRKEEEAERFYKNLNNMFISSKRINISLVWGALVGALYSCPLFIYKAKQARNFRMVNRECGITFYNGSKKRNFLFYPIENEYELRNCLLAGEYERKVFLFSNELLQQNLEG